MKTHYSLSDFDYELPKKLIAQQPAERREGSRLLVYNRSTGQIIDDYFYNVDKHLAKGTTIAVNNSKVEECRLLFENKEIFMLKAVNNRTVEALVRPGKAFKVNAVVQITPEVTATVDAITPEGHRILTLSEDIDHKSIEELRHIPLPPYIAQNDTLKERYQTRYAKPLGSKAAPTAGLHFSDELLDDIKKTHPFAEVTLHVGLGTFAPIDDSDIEKKILHAERFEVPGSAQQLLESAKHITAVGTTTLRTLESAFDSDRKLSVQSGETNIFIQPGYDYKMIDSLITNFHLPKSSLLMLVAAFMGYNEMHEVYAHAIKNEYRFFSFGDAMLII